MRAVDRWMLAGIIAATVGGPADVAAQATDSLVRPRPMASPVRPGTSESVHICLDYCEGRSHRLGGEPAFRIIGAAGQLLFMSAADSADSADSAVRAASDAAVSGLEPSQMVSIEVMKGGEVEKLYGKAYRNGVVLVTLNQKGTEAWLSAAAARAATTGKAPPP